MARAAAPSAHEMPLKDFLLTVDAKPKWVDRALGAFSVNDITETYELDGADSKLCCKVLSGTGQQVLGGLEGFLDRAINKFRKVTKEPRDERRRAEEARFVALDEARLAALEQHLAPQPPKPRIHVNIGQVLGRVDMKSLPQKCWPCSSQVDALAAAVEKSKKDTGMPYPFVYQELKKWVPSWVAPTQEGQDEAPKNAPVKELDLVTWSIAFDRYALAASICEQTSYGALMAHKDVCLEIAMKAHLEKRGRLLGVFYDKVCRKSWAERSICGDDSFELARAVTFRDEALLYRAQALYDEGRVAPAGEKKESKGASKSSWQPHAGKGSAKGNKSKSEVTCYKYACSSFPPWGSSE